MATVKRKAAKARTTRARVGAAEVAEMIDEATVDAYDESEQATGWFTMFENRLELPFETHVLGVRVTVEKIDLRGDNRIVAVCRRGKAKQSVSEHVDPQKYEQPGRQGSRRAA